MATTRKGKGGGRPRKPRRGPRLALPGGRTWAQLVVHALESVGSRTDPDLPVNAGLATLQRLYATVGRLIGEEPLSANHRAKVRQVVGSEPTIHRLQPQAPDPRPLRRLGRRLGLLGPEFAGFVADPIAWLRAEDASGRPPVDPEVRREIDPARGALREQPRYGRIISPATHEPIPAIFDPATGRKSRPLVDTTAALPNQAVLDDLVAAIAAASDVTGESFGTHQAPSGPKSKIINHYDHYDIQLFDPAADGTLLDMEELERLSYEHGALNTPALAAALGDATARLMAHGYVRTVRVSIRVASLMMFTDSRCGDCGHLDIVHKPGCSVAGCGCAAFRSVVSYFWSDERRSEWATITFAVNARVAASQLAFNLKEKAIPAQTKYITNGVAIPFPVEVSFSCLRESEPEEE